jgi:tRNA-specific 2-thiouridylase
MAKEKNKKVIVAMSGGIDSSVAAALLKRDGYDIAGVFMKFWQPRIRADGKTNLRKFENRCCSLESEKRARAVAAGLNIPFYVFNFGKEFKKKVVDYFLKEEKAGLTPNPCVACNKEIKFGLLLEKALKLDADFIATGHYSRLRREITDNKYKLLKAKDKNKDQSYFLWRLNQKQLARILFPVGGYAKTEVRKLAKKFKLPILGIPESQEICFVQTTVGDFFKKYFKEKPGKIVNENGQVIGGHQGLWLYTIGQRKGIKLAGGPYWVLSKDIKRNVLIATKDEKDLYKKELIAKDINWISGKAPRLPLKVKAQIRYRHKPASAVISRQKKGEVRVIFSKAQRAVTPGQSVVFYLSSKICGKTSGRKKNNELLGGGIIY